MKLKQLTEKLNNIVYIARSVQGLSNIINKNSIGLSSFFKDEGFKRNYFFLDTFPSRNNKNLLSLLENRVDKITVLITLNGDLVNQIIKPEGTDLFIHDKNLNQNNKIFSIKSKISNAVDIIEEVSVLKPTGIPLSDELIKLKNQMESRAISFNIYTNKSDFISNNRSKAISVPLKDEPITSPFLQQLRTNPKNQ